MRRHLTALLTMTSVMLSALGCNAISASDAPGAGGAGGGSGEFGGSTSGAGGGAGVPPSKSEVAAFSDGNTNIAACNPAMEKPPAVFLSVPSARAMVSGARVLGLLDPLASAASTPPPSFVDGSEIFNYYHIDYPAKASAELTIVTEMVATDDLGDYLLQIGVQAPSIQAARLPTSVTILVDTSTSMEGQSLLRARAAVRALAMGLNKDDILTLLTTDTDFEPVRRRAAGALDPALLQSADKITVSGTGSLGRALERAYEQATSPSSLLAGGLNRLVVITDGGAPPSAIDTNAIAEHWQKEQIQLVGVGVGSAAGYKNDLLAAATTAGHGPSLYLQSVDEAERALHQRFDEVMDAAASDVSISLQLPWIFKSVNADTPNPAGDPIELTLSDLGRGRSMIFRRPVRVCDLGTLAGAGDLPIEVVATWKSRPGMDAPAQTTLSSTLVSSAILKHPSPQMLKASAILAFTNALQSLDTSRFQDACIKVAAARAASMPTPNEPVDGGDPELDAILVQLNAHPLIKAANLPCK